MQRIIIIDDTNCKPLLEDFLKLLRQHVQYDVSFGNNSLQKQLLLECISEMTSQKKITVRSEGNIYLMNCQDISSIEAKNENSILHLFNDICLTTDKKIDAWQIRLVDQGFLRVHPNYLVNIAGILKLQFGETPFMELLDGEIIPVDFAIQDKVASKLADLIQ